MEVLADFDANAIRTHRTALAQAASNERLPIFIALHVVETLTAAACWEEAAWITDAIYQRIPQTTELHAAGLRVNLARIATRLEEAISKGRLQEVPELGAQWRTTEAQIAQDQTEHEHQRSLIPRVPVAH
jgi:hypothetical protein